LLRGEDSLGVVCSRPFPRVRSACTRWTWCSAAVRLASPRRAARRRRHPCGYRGAMVAFVMSLATSRCLPRGEWSTPAPNLPCAGDSAAVRRRSSSVDRRRPRPHAPLPLDLDPTDQIRFCLGSNHPGLVNPVLLSGFTVKPLAIFRFTSRSSRLRVFFADRSRFLRFSQKV
jgi:hypothetical protein